MNTENNFTFQIKPTIPDAKHAFRLYRASMNPEEYELFIVLDILGLLIGGGFLLIWGISSIGSLIAGQPIVMINSYGWLPVLWFILSLSATFDLIPSLTLWIAFRQNAEYHSQSYNATFDDSEIIIHGKNVNAKYTWDFYKEAVEGPREFILVYGKKLYFTVPKKVFQSEGEIDSFRNLLRSKLPKFRQQLKIKLDFQK